MENIGGRVRTRNKENPKKVPYFFAATISNKDTIYSFLCQYSAAVPAGVPRPARTDAARPTQILVCRGSNLFPPITLYKIEFLGNIWQDFSRI